MGRRMAIAWWMLPHMPVEIMPGIVCSSIHQPRTLRPLPAILSVKKLWTTKGGRLQFSERQRENWAQRGLNRGLCGLGSSTVSLQVDFALHI